MSYENFRHYTEDEIADLKAEFRPRKKPRGCSDRMCGAEDCPTCHPECALPPKKEDDDDASE